MSELIKTRNFSAPHLLFLIGVSVFIELAALYVLHQFGLHVLVLLLLVLATSVAVFINPFYGLLVCLFVEFSGIVWGLEIPFGFMAVVFLTGIGWFFDQTARMKFSFKLDVQYLWVAGFLIAILLSSFSAHDMEKTLGSFLSFTKLAFFYFLIIQLTETREQIRQIIFTIIAATVFSLVFGIVGMFVPLPIFGMVEQGFRFRGLTSDPNIMAIHILIIFPILFLYFFHTKKILMKWIIGLLLLISTVGLLATFSRSATIGFAAIAVSLLFAFRHNRTLMILSLAIFLISLFFVPDMFLERILSLKNIYQDPSLRWRVRLFIGAFNLFIEHPIFGIGMGNFVLLSNKFILHHLAVHNTFLEVAAETGVSGLFFFTGLIVSYQVKLFKAWKMYLKSKDTFFGLVCQGLFIAFAGIFISSLFLSLEEYFVLWTLFGVGAALHVGAEKLPLEKHETLRNNTYVSKL